MVPLKKLKVGEEDARLGPMTETPIVSCYFLLPKKVNNNISIFSGQHTFVSDRKVTCI